MSQLRDRVDSIEKQQQPYSGASTKVSEHRHSSMLNVKSMFSLKK